MIEREAPGGQAGTSSPIENYLGFHEGISGSELTRGATMQARRFGAEFVQPTQVVSLEAVDDDHRVHLSDHAFLSARSVVIASGVEWRRLRAPGVAELIGLGLHYGGIHGTPDDLVDREVVIVGGANSAGLGRSCLREVGAQGDDVDQGRFLGNGYVSLSDPGDRAMLEHRGHDRDGAATGPRARPSRVRVDHTRRKADRAAP